MKSFSIRRVYEPPSADDGTRILVDRLWPRGISKDRAKVDLWLKDIAPSDALRRRFHGNPNDWETFCAAYAVELGSDPARAAVKKLIAFAEQGPVTLIYASRNETRNNALALKAHLEQQAKKKT